jgi:CheY-like chemotaxis protein
MVRLVDDLLEVSRIDQGKLEIRRETVNLVHTVGQTVETVQPQARELDQRIELDLPVQPLFIEGDAVRIAQVVSNLLGNASKFTPPGGTITVSVRREGEQAKLRVSDTGIGIPGDKLETIFGAFVQLDATLERKTAGLGLGLALAKRLVEMHGGSISAASGGRDVGSEFTITLPLTLHTPAARAPSQLVGSGTAIPARRTLVVDDNRDAADSLSVILGLYGCETRTAYDGHQGLAAGAEFEPQVVILDLGLPGLNGYDTAMRIRASRWGESVLLIALTGWGDQEARARALQAGFDHHLTKPVQMDVLSQIYRGHVPA